MSSTFTLKSVCFTPVVWVDFMKLKNTFAEVGFAIGVSVRVSARGWCPVLLFIFPKIVLLMQQQNAHGGSVWQLIGPSTLGRRILIGRLWNICIHSSGRWCLRPESCQ